MFENCRQFWEAGFAARNQSSELPGRVLYQNRVHHYAWLSGWYQADEMYLFHTFCGGQNKPGGVVPLTNNPEQPRVVPLTNNPEDPVVVPLAASAVTEFTQP